MIDRNGTGLTGLRSEAHWGGKIRNVFPLNRSDSLPDWRLGGNFFDVISFLFGCSAETHVGGQATFDASEGQWKPGASTVSTRADLGAASSRSLFPQPLSCEHPQYQALHTQETILTRLLECAHSFVEDYVGLPQFTHRPILPCVQTIQLPGSSALCKPLEKRPSLLLNTH